jgi:hypothetical protein
MRAPTAFGAKRLNFRSCGGAEKRGQRPRLQKRPGFCRCYVSCLQGIDIPQNVIMIV